MKLQDMTGLRFGRLLVLSRLPNKHEACWLCQCDCGAKASVLGSKLRAGDTQSCGCLRREKTAERGRINRTHGKHGSPEYGTWAQMWNRCTNPANGNWPNYGARGITVCDRWKSFEAFLADMGPRPAGTTLDRINNNGNYEPENCRWATVAEQNGNRRTTVWIERNDKRQSLAAWAREVGISSACLSMRLRAGWPIERALKRLRAAAA